ncbi:hypothetical protein [Atlantibacter sp.]|uniref:hypothetical protein n=1 Tax=Atlantibacter sp. TaxID=1903473 RepID=UPI00289EFA00|nr:hypothetical protein [Atlantibacter sp.]
MRKLLALSLCYVSLLAPSISSALTINGQIHPERYTFFLNDQGSHELMNLNNRMVAFYNSSSSGDISARYAISEEGYTRIGIAPAPQDSPQNPTVRDDGKPVKAVTCVMSTVSVSTRTVDQTWCKDEIGAEYIGFKGWVRHDVVSKACRVGDTDCPVYLSLQGDAPTVRNDSVRFVPAHPPKPQALPEPAPKETDPAIVSKVVADLKANGCAIINKYKESPPQCGSVIDVETGQGMDHDGVRSYKIDYSAPGNSWREQWPVTLTYRDNKLIRFRDGTPLEEPVDIENPVNNKPAVTENKKGNWNITRNASSIKFEASNASGKQILMTCENREFTVATGQENSWMSSGDPMMTFSLGGKELSADETLFDALKSSAGQTLSVLIMGSANDSNSFSTAGLSGLMSSLSWNDCLYPEKATQQ